MRCRQCDYALWDLPSRKCPECGAPFKPSEYEFQPGAVQYLCPHCRQCYYGTDVKGHLWPRSFACVKCNQPIEMDQMLLVPAEGWAEEETSGEKLPWLIRGKIGFFKGFFKTVWMAMAAPSRVMKLLPAREQESGRLLFAVFANTFSACIGLLPFLVVQFIVLGRTLGGTAPGAARACGMGLGFFLMACLGPLIAVAIWSLVAHAALRLTGKTRGSFNDTFSVFCYSSGANIASAIPCLGVYFGWIWWVVSAIFMVRERHKVHGGRATLAVCAAPVLGFATAIGLTILLASSAPTSTMTYRAPGSIGYYATSPGGFAPSVSADAQTLNVRKALIDYAAAHNGKYPPHAIRLAVEDYFDPFEFVGDGTPTMLDEVRLDDTTTLMEFVTMLEAEQSRAADRIVRKMPSDVVAHRIGDYVMTYHGIEAVENPAGLWVVIRHVPPSPLDTYAVYVADAGGQVRVYSQREFLSRLQQQNALRSRRGLPPLPHPDSITLDKPIAAGRSDGPDATPASQ